MNTYTARFFATCPENGARIAYTLTIATGQTIRVEKINAVLNTISEGYHEQIADHLHAAVGGEQTLKAHHHGVDIETNRPMRPHWIKSTEAA